MNTHLGLMVIFAVCVAACFAVLLRDEPSSQVRLAAKLCAAFIITGLVLGWLLYPMPFSF